METVGNATESEARVSWVASDEPMQLAAPYRFRSVLAKQVLDVTFSLVILLLLAPVLAALAV